MVHTQERLQTPDPGSWFDTQLGSSHSQRTLLLALPTAFIHKIMDTDIVSVAADTSAQDVAATIARYDLLALPVLDDGGRVLGIVTVDDAIDAIMPEKVASSLPRLVRHSARRPRAN